VVVGVWKPLEEQDGNPYKGYYEPERKSGVVRTDPAVKTSDNAIVDMVAAGANKNDTFDIPWPQINLGQFVITKASHGDSFLADVADMCI
jgi:co-chaperonin GroES (HSP10)